MTRSPTTTSRCACCSPPPVEQRRPALLLAAVNLLLAAQPGAALAAYYPTHGGQRPADAQLWPAFTAFCAAHREELTGLLRQRSTQTNEIRRCVALRLGLTEVARRWPGPVALAELGASAGLNLLVDHYRYRLNDQELDEQDASPVLVTAQLRNGARAAKILGDRPRITVRLGVDQHPVDLADPAARAWLEAFIWPEHTADLATLRAAADLYTALPGPAVVRGDATTDTARLLGDLPGDEPIVVFTASLLSYLEPAARAAFADQLRQAATPAPAGLGLRRGPRPGRHRRHHRPGAGRPAGRAQLRVPDRDQPARPGRRPAGQPARPGRPLPPLAGPGRPSLASSLIGRRRPLTPTTSTIAAEVARARLRQ